MSYRPFIHNCKSLHVKYIGVILMLHPVGCVLNLSLKKQQIIVLEHLLEVSHIIICIRVALTSTINRHTICKYPHVSVTDNACDSTRANKFVK